MKKAHFKELRQKGFLRERSHFGNLFRCGVGQFLAIHPFAHQDATRAQIIKRFGYRHARDILFEQHVAQPPLIGGFVRKVQFSIKA